MSNSVITRIFILLFLLFLEFIGNFLTILLYGVHVIIATRRKFLLLYWVSACIMEFVTCIWEYSFVAVLVRGKPIFLAFIAESGFAHTTSNFIASTGPVV